eukprot:1617882-Ditylum_brightwellii.AAC.1
MYHIESHQLGNDESHTFGPLPYEKVLCQPSVVWHLLLLCYLNRCFIDGTVMSLLSAPAFFICRLYVSLSLSLTSYKSRCRVSSSQTGAGNRASKLHKEEGKESCSLSLLLSGISPDEDEEDDDCDGEGVVSGIDITIPNDDVDPADEQWYLFGSPFRAVKDPLCILRLDNLPKVSRRPRLLPVNARE